MLWFADIAASVDASRLQIINDSKTPSGRVHVGALRGVILHDAIFRALKSRGVPVRYMFGVDDYDPLDEVQRAYPELYEPHLGKPLCNVPAPPGSTATDLAEHYIAEFFQIFDELGVRVERYRMRDHYRAGHIDEAIDRILSQAAEVRRIYKEVSGSKRPEDWHPFQVVCESCGRIGTTEVTAYDGKEVTYACKPNLVKWAKGCGNTGKISPFGGRGKLPWKLEWTSKWRSFGVTIEGAGKDHTTKGGARDVSNACFSSIFGGAPPLNVPYEFFLVGGAKMSSSKGVGSSARDMADLLPPEILRFLILRTQPKNTVDFKLGEEFLIKLFNDFDRLHKRAMTDPKVHPDEKELHRLCEIDADKSEGDTFDASLQLVLTFTQMPHVDLDREIEARKGSPLTDVEKGHLARRVTTVRTFLDKYASDEDKTTLQQTLPARANELSQAQRGFLHMLAAAVKDAEWRDDVLQAKVFDTARRAPIAQAPAFQAVYRVLLDKPQGPPAGALMSVIERDFVLKRLTELPLDEGAFLRETAVTPEVFEAALAKDRQKGLVASISGRLRIEGIADIEVVSTDGKTYVHRVACADPEAYAATAATIGAA